VASSSSILVLGVQSVRHMGRKPMLLLMSINQLLGGLHESLASQLKEIGEEVAQDRIAQRILNGVGSEDEPGKYELLRNHSFIYTSRRGGLTSAH